MNIALIKYNGTPYALPEGPVKGYNLRAFFSIKKTHDLWGEGDKDDFLIPEDDSEFEVQDGMRFYSTNKKINQG